MNFSIDQIINLSKQGFTPQQIQAFDGAMTPAVNTPQPQPVYQAPQPQPVYQAPQPQPVYQAPQPQPVYQAPQPQPVYQAPQPQPVYQAPQPQPVYQAPQPQPVYQAPQPQPVYHNTPMQIPRSGLADTSAQLLDAIKTIQNANLAQVSGQSTKPMTAEDAGLAVLGIKEGNK